MIIKTAIFYLSTLLFGIHCQESWVLLNNPLVQAYPCKNVTDIKVSFEQGRPPSEENEYDVIIRKSLPKYTKIILNFDTEAVVTLITQNIEWNNIWYTKFYTSYVVDPDESISIKSGKDKIHILKEHFDSQTARIFVFNDNEFLIDFFDDANIFGFTVKGPVTGTVPYLTSLNINKMEYCKSPNKGYLDGLIIGTKVSAEGHLKVPDGSCGRRKVAHTELIVNGADTKPGDWPWHAALYSVNKNVIKYICGGTLLSKTFVLTAAHCTTVRGQPVVPETLNVVLGKYNIAGGDLEAQEKTVQEVIVHDNFAAKHLDNDIALLKLNSEVLFGDYVQPACLWFPTAVEKLPNRGKIVGTVIGWGFDQNNALTNQLRQATMPQISESDCIKKNPLFYSKLLNNKKFCAGLNNGTSACNGDSGGGFHVFVPDVTGSEFANATGAWYVYGIVSLSVSRKDLPVCDPYEYVIFTKIAEYRGWILKYVK